MCKKTKKKLSMYYDINIKNTFKKTDIDFLKKSEFSGYCITKTINQNDIKKFINFDLPFTLSNKPLFKKITVNMSNSSYNTKRLFEKCDLLCIKVINFDTPVDENICDLVNIDLTSQIKIKNINPNLFYEITISDNLEIKKDRLMWYYNTRMLINYTKGRNIIISSGAENASELKSYVDFMKLLDFLGINKKIGNRILTNSIKLLNKCAEKRFLVQNCIFNDVEEGPLKNEFLIKQYKLNNKT